ncbi:hypothetical protein PMIN04_010327 [Paraphaeosphaeria minitans]
MARHSNAQGNDPRKRKADALNPNSGTPEKRPYQNRTTSARESSPEPRPMARSNPKNVACTPLAAGETALLASPSHRGPNDLPRPAGPQASAFTTASQLQGSVSLLSNSPSIRRADVLALNVAGSERPLRETSAVPFVSSGVQSPGRSYSSLPSASLDGSEYRDGTCIIPTATMTRPTEVFTATAFPPATSLQKNTTVPSSTGLSEMNLQCELLKLLLLYMFPIDGVEVEVEQADLLRILEEVWAQKEEEFKLVLDDLFASHREALFGWIEELHMLSKLSSFMEMVSHSGMGTQTLALKFLVLNHVRTMRLRRWMIIKAHNGNPGLSFEDLLCGTFALMTNTKGSEQLFKKGVQKLRDTAFKEIRSEDLAILV